ncbi:MAG: succinylglutamate desuccinylase/aspartoacylase family protein [Anaerolineales bacterium]|nr:succinylglutamate desuccinylase/aspartoacylase family protein [Anaerolineales bacterium]
MTALRPLIDAEGITIGTAKSAPGSYAYGEFRALDLPSGGTEVFPVVIAQGEQPGPILWVTGGIHGDEYTALGIIQRLLTPELPKQISGAVVFIPTLNPAGLRVGERYAYYQKRQDPNRLFPEPRHTPPAEDEDSLHLLEGAYARLFEVIKATASALIDFHNYSIQSIPFVFRDPVYYFKDDESDKGAAQTLWNQTEALIQAFGFTAINEFASRSYLRKSLHRSVSGAALQVGRIPAFTAEMGGYLTIDPIIADAAAAGTRNVMRQMGILGGARETLTGITPLALDYSVRRTQAIHVPHTGIVRFLIRPGVFLRVGDPVAVLTDIWGRPLTSEAGVICADEEGYVIGLSQGAAFYEGEHLVSLAIRDESNPVLLYPD